MDLPKNAQWNYCPTICMFHSSSLNNKINRLHERCLRMIYIDKQSNFEELLVKDNFVTIHHRNIQRLAIQMYMVANSMSPDIMSEIFQLRKNTHYHLRHILQFVAHQIHSFYKGSRSGLYLGPKGWELIPPEIKAIGPIQEFNNKKKEKKWQPNDCPCRLSKVFINNVGFI